MTSSNCAFLPNLLDRTPFEAMRFYFPAWVRHRIARVIGIWLALLLFTPQIGWAQGPQAAQNGTSDLKQLTLEQLGDVEVTTVSKDPQEVMKTAAAIFVITQEDIRRSGATSIPEALRLAPGVEVARVDADHWSVAIRGLAGQFSKDLLVLIDGRSVYTPLFAGVYWDVQNVVLEDVDRIEVVRGPGGTIWGANAVNGVINIITKSAENTHGGLASLGGGNVDEGTGSIRYGGTAGKDFNYRVYGMGSFVGPEFHSDGERFDQLRMGQMGFRTDWKDGDKDSFTVQGDTYRVGSGERVSLASFSPPAETQPADTAYATGGNILARWQHTTGEGSDVQIKAYFDRTNQFDLEGGETRNTFDVDYIQHARVFENQDLTWGLGARVSPSNFIQTSPGVNFLPNKQTDSIYSGFLQYELPIVRDKLILTAGTKLEHNNFSGFEYEPSIRLLWTPTERQSFWTAVTRAVRTPSRQDQDVAFDIFAGFLGVGSPAVPTPVYFAIQGNPQAEAEQLIGYEAGYRTEIRSTVYVDFTAFYNSNTGLEGYGPVSYAQASPGAPIFAILPYANIVEGHTVGAEISPDWKITHWWQLRASYSYLDLSVRDKAGFTDVGNLLGSYEGSSPHSVGNFQSLFNLPKHLEFDATYRFTSGLPEYSLGGYSTADVRLGWHVGEGLDFSVMGQNLLQPSHAEFGGNPGPLVGIKRSAYAKMTWRGL
jgi:iron complex outermembrane receptor protein